MCIIWGICADFFQPVRQGEQKNLMNIYEERQLFFVDLFSIVQSVIKLQVGHD